ncbi:hypothetical protein [Dactylosporangium sp. NPDC049140]|uniref:hypothetical protein n=1 Tax=Dactylosporangium sp. NPDC049140 TaxID=3155647 RepID=UPI0033CB63CE
MTNSDIVQQLARDLAQVYTDAARAGSVDPSTVITTALPQLHSAATQAEVAMQHRLIVIGNEPENFRHAADEAEALQLVAQVSGKVGDLVEFATFHRQFRDVVSPEVLRKFLADLLALTATALRWVGDR